MKIFVDCAKKKIAKVEKETDLYFGNNNVDKVTVLFASDVDMSTFYVSLSAKCSNGRDVLPRLSDAVEDGQSTTISIGGVTYKFVDFTLSSDNGWMLSEGLTCFYVWLNTENSNQCVGSVRCNILGATNGYLVDNPIVNPQLREYLNNELDAFKEDFNDEYTEEVNAQRSLINNLIGGQPRYVNTSSNILALTTNQGVAAGTDTQKWYYWNGTQYVVGGDYPGVAGYDALKNSYPFVEWKDTAKENPFKNIIFYSYDSTKSIYLQRIMRNSSNVYAIVFYVTDGTTTKQMNLLNVSASNYTEKEENEFNVTIDNVVYSGKYWIDWSKVTNNSTTIYQYSYISKECFSMSYLTNIPSDYPFAKWTSTKDCPIYNIVFYGDYRNKGLYLDSIHRHYGTNPVHAIVFKDSDGNRYTVLNILSSNYLESNEVEFGAGNINGKLWIDWNKVTNNSITNYGIQYFDDLVYNISDSIIDIRNDVNGVVDYVLPTTITGVKGHPFSIYYYDIFKIDSLEGYHVYVSGTNNDIKNYGDRVHFSCVNSGTYSITIGLRKNNTSSIVSVPITINIVADVKPTIKAIFIGDSFIDGGKIQAELSNMLGNNITFYGVGSFNTTDSTGTIRTGLDEGRSGWSLQHYCSLASRNGIVNPFYNSSTSTFDFSYYMNNNTSFNDVTDVFILSGPNDNGYTAQIYINYYNTIVNSIKSYNSNIRIHLIMPLTCNCDGYAWGTRNNNGAEEFRYRMFEYGNALLDTYSSTSNVYLIPAYVNFNKDYDFATTTVNASDRNPAQMKVYNDNVHPNEYGYFSMADMIYADIIKNCN